MSPRHHCQGAGDPHHGPVSGAFRGFGVPQAALWQETLYDRLAEKAGIDRLEFRCERLCDGDASPTGNRCCRRWALAPVWMALRRTGPAPWPGAKAPGRGVGVASCWYGCGNTALPNPSTIRIGLSPAGEVILHQGATDIGQGSNTVIAQIAAEAWVCRFQRLPPDRPRYRLTPDAGKTSASRQTYVSGRAAEGGGKDRCGPTILRRANAGEGAATLALAGAVHDRP
jgi:aldehyde oxidoreductase